MTTLDINAAKFYRRKDLQNRVPQMYTVHLLKITQAVVLSLANFSVKLPLDI